jgi:mRNA interferase RelE/StbE
VAYTIEFLRTAHEELSSLPKEAQRQIIKRVEALKNDPRPAGAEQLQGGEKLLRIRVADYRVVYTVEGKQLIVLIVRIGHRKEVYENLKSSASRVLIWRQRKK